MGDFSKGVRNVLGLKKKFKCSFFIEIQGKKYPIEITIKANDKEQATLFVATTIKCTLMKVEEV